MLGPLRGQWLWCYLRQGLGEGQGKAWASGVGCDVMMGRAAWVERDRTTPRGKSNPAVATAGSVAPLHGGEGWKTPLNSAGGMRALNSTESDSPRRQPGWAARAGDGFPAHRQWRCACLGPAPSPRHSELRQAAPRALSRMALLVGASRCSPRLAERRPRRSRARSAPWASAPAKERAPSCPRGLARLALPRAQTHQLDQRRCQQSHSIAKHSSVRRLQLLPARALRHRSAAVAAHGELRLFMRSARSRGCCWCTRARTRQPSAPAAAAAEQAEQVAARAVRRAGRGRWAARAGAAHTRPARPLWRTRARR